MKKVAKESHMICEANLLRLELAAVKSYGPDLKQLAANDR